MFYSWLIRGFTHDLVEHVGGGTLDRALKRHLGIGNSTGLGMAPFLVSHPILLNNWVLAREAALAECRQNGPYDAEIQARLLTLAARVQAHLAQWIVADAGYSRRIAALRLAWPAVCDLIAKGLPEGRDGRVRLAERRARADARAHAALRDGAQRDLAEA